jgi:enoyl-CoA hydratase/carnithine racemase
MEAVLFEKEAPLGWITLNRPEKRNALSLELMEALSITLDRVANDHDIRVAIIRANGPVFCAGHDIKEMCGREHDIHHFRKIFHRCSELMQKLHKIPQPVIAQVHGIATAGGCQLVAACDLAVAESKARFATPGVKIGLFCSTPMVPLVRLIGRRRAMEMLLTGRFISADEAFDFGLINRVTNPEALQDETKAWALKISEASRFTLAFGKDAFYRQVDMSESMAYDYTKEAIALNCLAHDAQEGMTAFLEKRSPAWKHS